MIGIVLIIARSCSRLAGSAYWAHNFLVVSLFVSVAVLQNMLLSGCRPGLVRPGRGFWLAAYTVGIVGELWAPGVIAIGAWCGMAAAILLGLLFALPALRVQGYYLGFVTLSAAVVFPQMLVALNDYTNGINGISVTVPALTAAGPAGYCWIALLVIMPQQCGLMVPRRFPDNRAGRRMRVAAASPEAALTLGIDPGRMRCLAFSIAAIGTGHRRRCSTCRCSASSALMHSASICRSSSSSRWSLAATASCSARWSAHGFSIWCRMPCWQACRITGCSAMASSPC